MKAHPARLRLEVPAAQRPRTAGFSLIELLVAMVVLAVILVMFLQVVNGIVSSTKTQNQQMDSVAAARRVLDVINVDLQNAVIGENAAILIPSSNSTSGQIFNLLTARRGEAGVTNHRFLAVSYSLDFSNGHLLRKYGSVTFAQSNFLELAATAATVDNDPLARGILAIQGRAITDGMDSYSFHTAPSANWATNSYNSTETNIPPGFKALITNEPAFALKLTNRTRAVELWIAAVDDQNYELLRTIGKLTVARAALGEDPKRWREQIDSSDIPASVKSGIRILNKTIDLQ